MGLIEVTSEIELPNRVMLFHDNSGRAGKLVAELRQWGYEVGEIVNYQSKPSASLRGRLYAGYESIRLALRPKQAVE